MLTFEVGHKRAMATTQQSFHLWSLVALSETPVALAMTTRESKEGVSFDICWNWYNHVSVRGEKVRLFLEISGVTLLYS